MVLAQGILITTRATASSTTEDEQVTVWSIDSPPCSTNPTGLMTWDFDHLQRAFATRTDTLGLGDCAAYLRTGDRTTQRPIFLPTPTTLEKYQRQVNYTSQQWQSMDAVLPEIAPFPELHPQGRLGNVPILMWHDILPEKEVFFDITPEELEAQFQRIQELDATPVSIAAVVAHLRTGAPLPEKPVVLTFDDGYGGHYKYVYPLLKKYNFPATFSIYTKKMELVGGRTSVTWEQLEKMARDPLVTIVSHGINHPPDLRELEDEPLYIEIFESKRILEERLGIPINYFTYPVGHSDERVEALVAEAGYHAALSMDNVDEKFASASPDLLKIARFGQSRLEEVIPEAWGGQPLPRRDGGFNFTTEIRKSEHEAEGIGLILITGGRPETIHANTRYQLPEMLEGTDVVAAVDGAFFSLKYLDSNVLIGPALSRQGRAFAPGNPSENPLLNGRPLVLISPTAVHFIPFDADLHNTAAGIKAELPKVTDAFVGAAWLVKDSKPRTYEEFGDLFDFDAARHRAFWGINQAGQPVVGVTKDLVGSVELGEMLASLGFRDAVMLDSGGSTSLAYLGESLVGYTPRPVPHAVVLYAAEGIVKPGVTEQEDEDSDVVAN
ncbi:MAG: polysaccharide deacetylase family protein [Spirulina sp. SIO3F2]|nr:polysaccharide deacetylase family protein [Spirulina sp. SIO3F2]